MESTYRIYARVIGNFDHLDISEKQYFDLKESREILRVAINVEEKFELIMLAYREWEKDLSALVIDNMLDRQFSTAAFTEMRLKMNLRLGALMTFAKHYLDYLEHVVGPSKRNSISKQDVKKVFSESYDRSFEYRFVEALRAYAQHYGMPVHRMRSGGVSKKFDKLNPEDVLEFSVWMGTSKDSLSKDEFFKKKILDEMPEEFDLIIGFRTYVEELSSINEKIRGMMSEGVDRSYRCIDSAREEFLQKESDASADTLVAGKLVGRLCEDEVYLNLNHEEVRTDLVSKNRRLVNLSKRHGTTKSIPPKKS